MNNSDEPPGDIVQEMEYVLNNWPGKIRLLALFAGIAALLAASRPGWVSFLIGTGLVLAGESIRLWAAGHLHKTTVLITSGPYLFTRNPMYLGRLLIFTGLILAAWLPYLLTLPVLAAGLGVFFLYYMPRKERIEGARLEDHHGDAYRAYRAEVPALFPSFNRRTKHQERWRWHRFHRNRELVTALALALALVVLALRITS